ncbi:MAG: hypothetical protein H7X99_02295, partial [Saprospiraceae bacterium]|nr:hypothetical protein [Saprospiraceae bacterium]
EKWGQFIGTTTFNAPFYLNGYDDFVFTMTNASVDLSTINNITGIQFPDDDAYKNTNASWTGFYIEDINLTIPPELQLGGTNTSIFGHNLIIDNLGASGVVGVNNFLSTKSSAMGDWAFTVDNLGVTFLKNKFTKATVDGTMGVPLIDDDFNYFGEIRSLPNSDIWRLTIGPDGEQTLNINALKTGITIREESIITLDMDPNVPMSTWRPYADLYGAFNLNIGNTDFKNPGFAGAGLFDALAYIEDLLNINLSFNLPSFDFSGFKINHPDLPAGLSYGIDHIDANFGFNIGGIDFGIDDVDFLEVPDISPQPISFPGIGGIETNPVVLPALGFKFKIGAPGINFDVDFWGKKMPNAGYSFGKIDLDFDLFSFSCSGTPAPATTNLAAAHQIALGSSFNCGGFVVNVDDTDITKGTIAIPYLPNSNLHVTLSNIALNSENKMISGDVTAEKNLSLFEGDPVTFGPQLLPIDVPLLQSVPGIPIDFTQNFDLLPFSLVNKIEEVAGIDLPFDFLLSGINFTPQGAALDVVLAVEMGNKKLKFGAKGLQMSPSGVNLGQIRFYLLEEIGVEYQGWNMSLIPTGINGDSYVSLSCQGLENFVLNARYNFGPDYINTNNALAGVFAEMTLAGEKWGQFIGTTTFNAPFYLNGYNDFVFTMTNASVDLSNTSNITGIQFPDDDAYKNTSASWTGFYIEDINLTIPQELQLGGTNTSIFGHNLIIDNLGASGVVGVKNFLSAQSNSKAMGDWKFTVDSVGITFLHNNFRNAVLEGMIGIPMMSKDFEYRGLLNKNSSSQYVATLQPKNDAIVGLAVGPTPPGNSTDYLVAFTIQKNSSISATYNSITKKFQPGAVLCGNVEVHLDKSNFPSSDLQDVISAIEDNLPGNISFKFDADVQLCLGIDPSLKLYGGRMYKLLNYAGSVSLPGFQNPFSLDNALSLLDMNIDFSVPNPNVPSSPNLPDWPTIPTINIPGFPNISFDNFPNITLPNLPGFSLPNFPRLLPDWQLPNKFIPLGFNFHLPAIPGISFDLGCWAIAIPDVNRSTPDFKFATFNVKFNLPEFSCKPKTNNSFAVTNNTGSINVPFLGRSFEVVPVAGTNNYRTKPDELFFVNKTLKTLLEENIPSELNFDLPEGYNFEIKGITFNAVGNGVINLELTLGGVSFIGALPIHPGGINFDGFKFGPGTDINFGN